MVAKAVAGGSLYFRAFNGPVSLKRWAGAAAGLRAGKFPGLQRPGLIEAWNRAGESKWIPLISGPSTARSH